MASRRAPAYAATLQAEAATLPPSVDDLDDEIAAREEYFRAFGQPGPHTFGVNESFMAAVLRAAVRHGRPIPEDFNWYPDLPPGAVV